MIKRMLAASGLVGVLLFAGAHEADAHVGFSFGIGVPGFTYYQPPAYYPPPVVYREYPSVRYYEPRTYYGERTYYRDYDDDDGWRRHDWRRARWHGHGRHCDRD